MYFYLLISRIFFQNKNFPILINLTNKINFIINNNLVKNLKEIKILMCFFLLRRDKQVLIQVEQIKMNFQKAYKIY
jgi:hypothetical protein